ncbi:unnamed protein product, partial [Didymodactylos carnosus]
MSRDNAVQLVHAIPISEENEMSTHDSETESNMVIKKLKTLEIYKYSDTTDIILMLIGTIAALATGACFALVIFLYQIVTGALVNYGKDQQRNSSLATPLNFSNQTTSTTLFTTMTDLVK